MYLRFLFLLFFIVAGTLTGSERAPLGEYIVRLHDEYALQIPPKEQIAQKPYPWQPQGGEARAITKEYFRCKGSSLNPPHIVTKDGKETTRFFDCSGSERHSLPLRDGKEFIFPILIDLLNHVQKATGKNAVVTSGHRCMTHQAFLDPSPKASGSKHLVGAEVDFYVQGLEEQPMTVVQLLLDYYKNEPKEYKTFQRFEKNSDVSTSPWLNKEIFIKLFKRNEGRNFDNRHPYPYISIQVRFDREKNERVVFSPEQAQGLLRK